MLGRGAARGQQLEPIPVEGSEARHQQLGGRGQQQLRAAAKLQRDLRARHEARLEGDIVQGHTLGDSRGERFRGHFGAPVAPQRARRAAARSRSYGSGFGVGTRQRTLGKPPRSVGEEQKTVAIRRAALPNAPKNALQRRARGRVLVPVRLNRARLGSRGCRLQMPERGARRRIRIDPHIHTRTPPRTQGRQPRVALPRKVVVQRKVDNQRAAWHRSVFRRTIAPPEQRANQHEPEPRGCTSQERPGGQGRRTEREGRARQAEPVRTVRRAERVRTMRQARRHARGRRCRRGAR